MEKVNYYHGQTKENRRFTLAYQKNDNGIVNVSAALCSENDQFSRETGRNLATERLSQDNHTTQVVIPQGISIHRVPLLFHKNSTKNIMNTFNLLTN